MDGNGWHFCEIRDGKPMLRDGRPLVIGERIEHDGPLVICERGLHWSERLIDALEYAPGPYLCRVLGEGGEWQGHDDKLVGRARTALCGFDATRVLREFAARIAYCALLAERERGRDPHPDSWAAVASAMDFAAGRIDAKRLSAACAAAWAAARDSARDSAWAAAWAAARNAAWAAAMDSARDSARDAANDMLTAAVLREIDG